MKMALFREKGLILKQGHFTKKRPFTKKAYLLFLILLRVPMTSHSFRGLFSLHSDVHTIVALKDFFSLRSDLQLDTPTISVT